jgi:hypothetical protein
MEREQTKAGLAELGFALTPSGPEQFTTLIREQGVVYEKRIREVGLTAE